MLRQQAGRLATASLWALLKSALVGSLLLQTGGCAYAYVDREGRRHVVGLLHVQLPATAPQTNDSLRTTTIGISLVRSLRTTELSIGYNAASWTYLPMDSCAIVEVTTADPVIRPSDAQMRASGPDPLEE